MGEKPDVGMLSLCWCEMSYPRVSSFIGLFTECVHSTLNYSIPSAIAINSPCYNARERNLNSNHWWHWGVTWEANSYAIKLIFFSSIDLSNKCSLKTSLVAPNLTFNLTAPPSVKIEEWWQKLSPTRESKMARAARMRTSTLSKIPWSLTSLTEVIEGPSFEQIFVPRLFIHKLIQVQSEPDNNNGFNMNIDYPTFITLALA